MSTEAQRLISVSLTKIAHSRAQRGGVSLHKNLLVATVLQRARYIFMAEAYHMVHSAPPQQPPQDEYDEDTLLALTAEEAGISDDQPAAEESASSTSASSCDRCVAVGDSEENKENQLPPPYTPTYIDLDKDDSVLRERNNTSTTSCASTKCLKRRRETEDAVASILPKRKCCESETDDEEVAEGDGSMEIDRITSLVSIFSFGGALNGGGDVGKMSRSTSTPDLCSAQAKEGVADSIQQRSFLAMTV